MTLFSKTFASQINKIISNQHCHLLTLIILVLKLNVTFSPIHAFSIFSILLRRRR